MKIDPKAHKILLTEPPMNPAKNREMLVERIFEKYEFGAANVSIQAMLTLYAQVLEKWCNININLKWHDLQMLDIYTNIIVLC